MSSKHMESLFTVKVNFLHCIFKVQVFVKVMDSVI